jgi:hypothetical protein
MRLRVSRVNRYQIGLVSANPALVRVFTGLVQCVVHGPSTPRQPSVAMECLLIPSAMAAANGVLLLIEDSWILFLGHRQD